MSELESSIRPTRFWVRPVRYWARLAGLQSETRILQFDNAK